MCAGPRAAMHARDGNKRRVPKRRVFGFPIPPFYRCKQAIMIVQALSRKGRACVRMAAEHALASLVRRASGIAAVPWQYRSDDPAPMEAEPANFRYGKETAALTAREPRRRFGNGTGHHQCHDGGSRRSSHSSRPTGRDGCPRRPRRQHLREHESELDLAVEILSAA